MREIEAEVVASRADSADEWPEIDLLQVVGEEFASCACSLA
ncbi:hypothetical protein [Burkholderia gladioli]|nr:hypothetical protein [Burkholderia gladioli]